MVTKVVVVSHGVYTLQNAYNELLQTFFTNKWYKGHDNITPNSRRAILYLCGSLFKTSKLVFIRTNALSKDS